MYLRRLFYYNTVKLPHDLEFDESFKCKWCGHDVKHESYQIDPMRVKKRFRRLYKSSFGKKIFFYIHHYTCDNCYYKTCTEDGCNNLVFNEYCKNTNLRCDKCKYGICSICDTVLHSQGYNIDNNIYCSSYCRVSYWVGAWLGALFESQISYSF